MKDLAIIILNYNSSNKVINQVSRLMGEGISSDIFYLVDNNSEEKDRKALQGFAIINKLKLIQSNENQGYAVGNRLAIESALDDDKKIFLILNPDIEISNDVIRSLHEVMTNNDELFILGPRICDKEDRKIIFSDGGTLDKANFFEAGHINGGINVDDVDIAEINYDIDYINGSAIIFRRETLELIGMMREDFFMYFEESEWCYRLKQIPTAKQAIITSLVVYHELSKSDLFKNFYMTRNRIYLCRLYNIPHQKFIMQLLYQVQKYLFNTKGNLKDNVQLFTTQLRAILEGEFKRLKKTNIQLR